MDEITFKSINDNIISKHQKKKRKRLVSQETKTTDSTPSRHFNHHEYINTGNSLIVTEHKNKSIQKDYKLHNEYTQSQIILENSEETLVSSKCHKV